MPFRPRSRVGDPLTKLLDVRNRPEQTSTVFWIKVWLLLAAIANYVSTAVPLISSVGHAVFGIGNWASSWTDDPEPTRPWLFWIFLAYGCLWGTLFLFIRADPIGRRSLLRVGIAEKLVATIAIWTDYLVFHDIELALPLIILVTDVLFVFVFVWALRAADGVALRPQDDPELRRPSGSSPPARWLLRLVAVPTFAGGVLLAVAGVVARSGASADCVANVPASVNAPAIVPPPSCTVLGSSDLWSMPPFLTWVWGGMAAVMAGLLLWASAEVVRRRDVLGFGVAAQLIPVVAVVLGRFVDNSYQRPSTPFLVFVVVFGTFAAGAVWLARRLANASALVLGIDLPPRAAVAP
jgi:hypothetical protein